SAASIIHVSRPSCWDDNNDNARFIPVVFRECIQIINDDITRGHDMDEPLKFSFDPTFQPDIRLPKYWKQPGVNCGIGVDLAPGLEGYDRTTLRDIKDSARAVAVACVIRPPHAGGFMQIGWHNKLGVLISGQRALSTPKNGTLPGTACAKLCLVLRRQVERLPDIASSNLIASPRMHYYQIKKSTPRVPLTPDEAVLTSSFDNNTLNDWSYYYTHGVHLAATNRTMAQWTADRWSENGFQSRLDEYHTYLNYPVSHSLSLTYPNGSVFRASLEEAVLTEDETTTYPERIPTFHGYSFTGNATAEYVYVGRGQVVDFEALVALNVSLEGKIALAKYGGPFRGLKVKNAALYGMIGCVLFTDPGDDGNITEANGYAAYPDGPARNPTSVQRGSVQFLSTYPGDPTTPGYASKQDSPRADKSPVVPNIPSLPISYAEAIPLLRALDGSGTPGSQVNRTNWVGALNATYSTGPAPGAVLSMSNVMRDAINPIWDAVGIINGTNQDEVLVIGNHRDAWIIGGAADPNSGSAIMVELSKAFGRLLATGWQPRRTIVVGLLLSSGWFPSSSVFSL
ncbi:MAG: hypothetical protein Q9180_006096, partial [Flavoplaca navasiana]